MQTKIVARVPERRVECGLLIVDGVRRIAQRRRDETAVTPAGGDVGRKGQRAVEHPRRGFVVAALMERHAEIVRRIGVIGVSAQNAAMSRLGLGQAPGLMVVERDAKRRGGMSHGGIEGRCEDPSIVKKPTPFNLSDSSDPQLQIARLCVSQF
jgi:hypothetical protein